MNDQTEHESGQRYVFESGIHGLGGFGRVVKGRDNILERDVAVKILAGLDVPEARERFKREGKILANLKHPNIPAIYDVSLQDEQGLILFEYVEGTTLRQLLDDQGTIELSDARLWFSQVAAALQHAHENGVTHRDVKPENIIVAPDLKSAYLVDFGIAFSEGDDGLTREGYVVGTPGYMSPEQEAGQKIDSRTDIYSLGVTLYEALAGNRVPAGQYQDLAAVNEAIPPQIDELVQKCLVSRTERLDSAREFAASLAGALRPARPLSEVLSQGSLYEIANALEDLTPEEFTALPQGQRSVILIMLDDIVQSEDPRLHTASERLLKLLLERGLLLPAEEYRSIVVPSLTWAFEIRRGPHTGSNHIRRALETAAQATKGQTHTMMMEEIAEYVSKLDIEGADGWLLHSLRTIIQTLLANPACRTGADSLVQVFRQVKEAQRERKTLVE